VVVSDPCSNALVFDPREVVRRCHDGDTLVLNHIEIDHAPAKHLIETLRHQPHADVTMNVIASVRPGIQGFARHTDVGDVIVLQVEGRKRCRVCQPGAAPHEPAYVEQILTRGDVLYIPCGHPHEAVANREPALHVAVLIKRHTGLTFLDWLTAQVRKDPAWQVAVPVAVDHVNADDAATLRHLDALAESLAERLRDPMTVRRYFEDVVWTDPTRGDYRFPE
jgi:ribosomal protein L16 Arg81 hydroxylase